MGAHVSARSFRRIVKAIAQYPALEWANDLLHGDGANQAS
jgi:hypothetical protein